MSVNTIDIVDRGMKCLSEHLGADETELFITTILKERFDYTMWRRTFVDSIESFDDLDRYVEDSKLNTGFSGNARVVM